MIILDQERGQEGMKKGQGGRSITVRQRQKSITPHQIKEKKGENAGYEHFDFSPFPVLFTGLSDTNPFI